MKPTVNRLVICTIILLCGLLSGSVLAGVWKAIPSFGWSQTQVNGKAGRTLYCYLRLGRPMVVCRLAGYNEEKMFIQYCCKYRPNSISW